jgi:PAS domain S-box-containing protein
VTLFAGRAGDVDRRLASQVAGFAAAAIAVMALIGWWASMPLLSSWGSAMMTPVDAANIAALGLALMCPVRESRVVFAIGLVVAVVGVVGFGLNHGLVQLPQVAPDIASPGAGSGMGLAIAAAAAALALSRFERHHVLALMLAGLGGAMAVFAIVEYLAGLEELHGRVKSPGLPTPVSVLCVVIGIPLRIGTIPAPRKSQPLWRLLIVLACAILAPLLLLSVYAGFRITDAQFEQARKDLAKEAHALSAAVDHEINGDIERLQALATSPSLRRGDFAEFQRQAEAPLASGHSGNIMLIDRDMRQLVNTWVPFGTAMPKAIVRAPVERALATGKPQVTGLFLGPFSRQLLFSIIVPVQIEGENRYALVRSPDRSLVTGLLKSHDLPPDWQAMVADAAHRVIARSGEEENGSIGTELPASQWRRAGPGGVFERADPEGRAVLEAYALSNLTGWEAIVWEPKTLVEAPIRALWATIASVALLGFTLAVGLALLLGRIIARSVGQTARAAAALGQGGPLPSEETPVAEVNTLMAELRRAAAMRQATEDLLRDSEARFRAMFEVSSVGKIETECGTGRFLAANAAMCRLVGYSEAELLAMTAFDITHPDECERDRQLVNRLLAGELPAFDVEKRYIRKDGTPVWVQVTANLIRDESGRPLRSMAVIQDLTARKQAEQELQASKDRLQLAFDATRLGWWHFDPVHRRLSGDERANEIFDLPKDGGTVEEIEEKRMHPDDLQRVRAAFAASLDPADPKPLAIEYRIRLDDGGVRWVENHGLAAFEGAGAERRLVGFVGTVQDITERKEREEKERLLMGEINHRAKNMLSVVDAIAHQTAARGPEDFVERFSERIQALSANQDLLVRNEWNGVDIADLVRAQLAHFADLIGFRIAVQGPNLRLTPAAAQAIGLALHELATNAGKYGALSTEGGHVDVGWGTDGMTFTMSWTERGGPPVSAPERRGFGTIVMEAMAERSVGGAVNLDFPPSGVTWRLTCPAANVLEPGWGMVSDFHPVRWRAGDAPAVRAP